MSARISSPVAEEFTHSDGTPARNPWDKLFNMGTNLVSSSSRGSILAVCCSFQQGCGVIVQGAAHFECRLEFSFKLVEHETGHLIAGYVSVTPA